MSNTNGILVILGSKDDDSTFITSITETLIDLIDKNIYGNIYLIGLDYRSIHAADLPVEVVVIPDHPSRVFNLRPRVPSSGIYPPFQASMHYSTYYKRMEFTKDSETKITFACFDKQLASNIFELASIVFTETLEHRRWLIVDDLAELFSNFGTPIPDIFKGADDAFKIRDQILTQKERQEFKDFIIQGMDILRCQLRAGYYFLENNKVVPGWSIHTGVPWNSLIIGLFNVIPGSIDKTQYQEMSESAKFRKVLTDITLGVLSNYISVSPSSVDIKPSIKQLKGAFESNTLHLFGDNVKPALKLSRQKILKDIGEKEYVKDMIAWTSKDLWDQIRIAYSSSDDSVL